MAQSSNLGFPRLGLNREWKRQCEAYWAGKCGRDEVLSTARMLRERHWLLQLEQGLDSVPVGDFALYDHVLETALMLNAVPARFAAIDDALDLTFAMARGLEQAAPMEMTKWFDSNYHYIVPELGLDTELRAKPDRLLDVLAEAKRLGVPRPRPVVLGPASFLLLAKTQRGLARERFVPSLIEAYSTLLKALADADIDWVQVDEPALVLDLDEAAQALMRALWQPLNALERRPKLLVATYFGSIAHHAELAVSLGDGLHLDLVRAPEQLERFLALDDGTRHWSLGVVDGRNVWRSDPDTALGLLRRAKDQLGGHDRLWIAPSCSLLHSPIDLDAESALDPELRSWLAFAKQKLAEVVMLGRALVAGEDAAGEALEQARRAVASRRASDRVHAAEVGARVAAIDDGMSRRASPFAVRAAAQRAKLRLPELPTTTIGSFPQTGAIRQLRAAFKRGALDRLAYEAQIREGIAETIRRQEAIGLDVLVHGELERGDMVEYFGEQLDGFAFTQHGWVQSYGSRAVKPPIIYGDVRRREPMTVAWSAFAQSCTQRPMKAMLTGPVTMLQWSFVRDDQSREQTALQLALAIRDEVGDLEAAGLSLVQIDEPAFREGLPLRRADWASYLAWAVRAFRIASSGVRDTTQIHTHMCYSEFNAIFDAIAALDADVISIEASRSKMELLDAFHDFDYPNDIGPGVYDIHSPRVPSREEVEDLLRRALRHIPRERLWVNPDCGLKTRSWDEVERSLTAMVEAARALREAP